MEPFPSLFVGRCAPSDVLSCVVRLGDLHVVTGVVVVARIRSTVPTVLHLPYHRSTMFEMGFAVAADLPGEPGLVPPHPPTTACCMQ